jgi:alpha-mannosidase
VPYYYEKANLDPVLVAIENAIYTPISPLTVEAWITREPVLFEARRSGDYRRLAIGEPWGKL